MRRLFSVLNSTAVVALLFAVWTLLGVWLCGGLTTDGWQ